MSTTLSTRDKANLRASLIFKLISLIASVYGLCFTIKELKSFTYYTTLSNVAIDVVLIIAIIMDVLLITKGKNYKTNGFYICKYMMTVAISLTLLIYMFILAPTSKAGFFGSYFNNYGGSFGVHFIGPVFAILDFLLFDYDYKSKRSHGVFAVIPPLCYVAFVVILATAGVRWGEMYAPYNFLNYGAPTGWFGWDLSQLSSTSLGIGVAYLIVVLLIFFLLLGQLYLWISNKRRNNLNKTVH